MPNLEKHSLYMASATVSASLFTIAMASTFGENSIMYSLNFLLLSAVIMGLNKSA